RRHTRFSRDWSSDMCSSDLIEAGPRRLRRWRFLGHGRFLRRLRTGLGRRAGAGLRFACGFLARWLRLHLAARAARLGFLLGIRGLWVVGLLLGGLVAHDGLPASFGGGDDALLGPGQLALQQLRARDLL